jgi:hypothetical protein
MLSEASFEGILVHVDGVVIDVNQQGGERHRQLARGAGEREHVLAGADAERDAGCAGRCLAHAELGEPNQGAVQASARVVSREQLRELGTKRRR